MRVVVLSSHHIRQKLSNWLKKWSCICSTLHQFCQSPYDFLIRFRNCFDNDVLLLLVWLSQNEIIHLRYHFNYDHGYCYILFWSNILSTIFSDILVQQEHLLHVTCMCFADLYWPPVTNLSKHVQLKHICIRKQWIQHWFAHQTYCNAYLYFILKH